MNRSLLFLFALLALCVALVAAERSFLEHQEAIPVPSGWRKLTPFPLVEPHHSNRQLHLIFAVKQRNLEVLEETFWAVSTPSNEQYGRHLSLEQLNNLIAPEAEDVRQIVGWLMAEGVEKKDIKVTMGGEFIHTNMSVATAARIFEVTFHTYHHSSGKIADVSVGPYSVPSFVAEKLDLISGLVGFPTIYSRRPKMPASTADLAITPDVIRARYNITDVINTPNSLNARAVAEFQAEYYSTSDLKEFWNKFVTNAPSQDIAKVIGTNQPGDPGDEASLDVQYIMGVVPNISTWFYSLKSDAFWNDLLVWVSEIANETSPPWVHSVSYGSQGDYPSDSYRERLNAEFQKAGTRGISIIFASGDSGSGCESNGEDKASCKCTLYPSFPATCPYITSIGATGFISGNTGPEKAVMRAEIGFKSGGGFSQEFPLTNEPSQATAVQGYLNSGVELPPACSFNASNRATPDASALGDIHFQIVQDGQVESIGGTSASAPTFSAIISLLNEQLLNANKATLGFLNPWLYKTAASQSKAFFDVTEGDNIVADCCSISQQGGFKAAAGWDPATGVGTPNYVVLKTTINA